MRAARTLFAATAIALFAPACDAAMLYKSIAANGVIQFSDTPPDNGVVVEQRVVRDPGSDAGADPGGEALENPLQTLADGTGNDAALARANAQVDLAEHALALARRSTWSEREGLRLDAAGRSSTDDERIRFYEGNVKAARASLIEAMARRSR